MIQILFGDLVEDAEFHRFHIFADRGDELCPRLGEIDAARATIISSSATSGQATRRAQASASTPRPRAESARSMRPLTTNDTPRHAATIPAAYQPRTVESSAIRALTRGPSSARSNVKPSIAEG